MIEFKPGDTVCLKSGGPKMTVNDYQFVGWNDDGSPIKNDGKVLCEWFNGKKLETYPFNVEQIEHCQ